MRWACGKTNIVCAYIYTTKSKWVVSLFFDLFFMKDNVEKDLTSSIVPKPLKA